MNVEFEYMYRDFGNFKNYNSVVFGNQLDLSADEIHRTICGILGGDHNFEAAQLGLPEMFFKQFPYDPELDWPMHEYYAVKESDLPVNDLERRDILDLILSMSSGHACTPTLGAA